jgi:hypothetical protein
MKVPLTDRELGLLMRIRDAQPGYPVIPIMPIRPALQSLIDRGYIRTVELMCIMGKTGELGLKLTEAGEVVVPIAREERSPPEELKKID